MADRVSPDPVRRPPASYSMASGADQPWGSRDEHESLAATAPQRRGGYAPDVPLRDDSHARHQMVYDNPESNRLTEYLVACFEAADESLKQIVKDSPYIYGAGGLAFAAALIPFMGVAPTSAAALVIVASMVTSVMTKVLPNIIDRSDSSRATKLAAFILNTAAVTLAVAAALGIPIPGAKGLLLCASITAGVKYAQMALSDDDRRPYRASRY